MSGTERGMGAVAFAATILLSSLAVAGVAAFQYVYVLHSNPRPVAFVAPLLVGAVFGALLASVRASQRKARALHERLRERERAITELNRDLEQRVRLRTAELEEKTLALVEAQRREVVGRVAGGVAHDFNNILTAVMAGSAALREELAARGSVSGPIAELLEEIDDAVERARGVSAQLLTLSRSRTVGLGAVDLSKVVRQVASMLRRVMPESVRLQVGADEHPATVTGDPTQLEQLVLNLALNARDAMPRGGDLEVWVVREGPVVVLRVSDTGEGMDEATRSRMFDAYFTTKETGKGTGLGLAVVQEVARRCGATIQVRSSPGNGTRVTVAFPVSGHTAEAPEAAPAPAPAVGPATVLLIEDDEAVRRPLAAALARGGHTVLEAGDGAQAERQLAASAGRIDFVVCDVVLPGTNGPALLARLAGMGLTAPALFMSGYSPEELELQVGGARVPVLQKPFPPSALLERLAVLLAEAAKPR